MCCRTCHNEIAMCCMICHNETTIWELTKRGLQIKELFQPNQMFHLKLLMFPINVVSVHHVHSLKIAKNGKFSTTEWLDAVIEPEQNALKITLLDLGSVNCFMFFCMKSGVFFSLLNNSKSMLFETVKLFLLPRLWLWFVSVDRWNGRRSGYT